MNAIRLLVDCRPAVLKGCLSVAMLVLAGPLVLADDPDDDPFSLKYKADAVKSDADKPDNDNPLLKRIRFTAQVSPQKAKRGEVVTLTITGHPINGNHTYPITKRSPDQQPLQLSRIIYAKNDVVQPLWPVKESEPEFLKEFDGVVRLEYDKEFTWSQDLYIRPTAPPGNKPLKFTISLQVCDAANCTPPGSKYPPMQVDVEVLPGPAAPLTPELEKRLKAEPPEVEVVFESAGADQSVWGFMVVSMGAAFLMLLTPCVFPMIPITVSFFLKQSEKEHHNALLTAGVYSLTIIVVLTGAVFVLSKTVVTLANDPWLNLALGAVLVFFALSLFGMYEIELPSFLSRFTSAREGQGGMLGAIFMALTFTLTSFTCTGPFLGPLLVAAKESQLGGFKLFMGCLAYSVTFAAPFFFLALFPRMLKSLPKSGGWLNAIKVVMGFLELAAALKFIANTDLALNPGDPMLFSYDSVLCAWIALSVACSMYLFGIYRLPHDSPSDHVGVVRMLFASIFLGLAVYMIPALWRVTPQGFIGKGLVAFLPLDTRADLDWYRDPNEAWEQATRDPNNPTPIFIDFTGVNCTNCRYNEKNLFPQPKVQELLKGLVRLQMYTDTVPEKGLSSGEALEQAQRNSKIQGDTFGDITNPFYAIVLPNRGKEPWVRDADGKLKINGTILGIRKGLIPDNKIRDFVAFMKSGR
jgi:thiol:disulfide interchange protein